MPRSRSSYLCRRASVDAAEAPPSILWNTTFGLSADDEGQGVASGPDGHPVVAGFSCPGDHSSCNGRVIKYGSATGSEHWNVVFDSAQANDLFFAVQVGEDGHPVAVGYSCNASLLSCAARIAEFDGASGALLWTVTHSPRDEDFGAGAAVRPDERPSCRSNRATATSSPAHLHVAKFDGGRRDPLERRLPERGDQDMAIRIAVGADGNAIVTGPSSTRMPRPVISERSVSVAPTASQSGPDVRLGLRRRGAGASVRSEQMNMRLERRDVQPLHGCDVRTIKFNGARVRFCRRVLQPRNERRFGAGVAIGANGRPVVVAAVCAPSPTAISRRSSATGRRAPDLGRHPSASSGYDFPLDVRLLSTATPFVRRHGRERLVRDIRTISIRYRRTRRQA